MWEVPEISVDSIFDVGGAALTGSDGVIDKWVVVQRPCHYLGCVSVAWCNTLIYILGWSWSSSSSLLNNCQGHSCLEPLLFRGVGGPLYCGLVDFCEDDPLLCIPGGGKLWPPPARSRWGKLRPPPVGPGGSNFDHLLWGPGKANFDHLLWGPGGENFDHLLCGPGGANFDHLLCSPSRANFDNLLWGPGGVNIDPLLWSSGGANIDHLLCSPGRANVFNAKLHYCTESILFRSSSHSVCTIPEQNSCAHFLSLATAQF